MAEFITKHFTFNEFACKNGVWIPEELKHNTLLLCIQLEVIRSYLEVPVIIESGYRTKAYNDMLRRNDPSVAINSQHIQAAAADIKCPPFKPMEVYTKILYLINTNLILDGGLHCYPTWVHYDVRGSHARW